MKKCYYFPKWEEKEDAMISFDENYICFLEKVLAKERNVFDGVMWERENPDYFYRKKIIKSSKPQDPILQKLCEITDAQMYGDYIVLIQFNHELFIKQITDYKLQEFSFPIKNDDKPEKGFLLSPHRIIERTIERYFRDSNGNYFGHTYPVQDFLDKICNILYKKYCNEYKTMDEFENEFNEYIKIIKNYQNEDVEYFQAYSKFLRKEDGKWEEYSSKLF